MILFGICVSFQFLSFEYLCFGKEATEAYLLVVTHNIERQRPVLDDVCSGCGRMKKIEFF